MFHWEKKEIIKYLIGKTVEIKKIETPPLIDGNLDDSCWNKLKVYDEFIPKSKELWNKPMPTINATSFKICHDNRTIYLAVTCRQQTSGITAKAKNPSDPLIRGDDRVIISLYPWQVWHCGLPLGAKITITAGGLVAENGEGYGERYWKTGTQAIVNTNSEGYTIEAAIPFKAVMFSPDNGRLCKFNIQRVVQGPTPERSAWYPINIGRTFAVFERSDSGALLSGFPYKAIPNSTTNIAEIPIMEENWEFHILQSPSNVTWPEWPNESIIVTGGKTVLLSKNFYDIQPGHSYDLEVDYSGTGSCEPSLVWFARAMDGISNISDIVDAVKHVDSPTVSEEHNFETSRIRSVAPVNADAIRFQLLCVGDVQVNAVRLVPHFPLDVCVDIDADADKLVTGHVVALRATIHNISNKTITGLKVNLAYPHGVDRRVQAVSPSNTLKQGDLTQALWWLTPIYTMGQADFVVIVEADDMPRIVERTRWPEK